MKTKRICTAWFVALIIGPMLLAQYWNPLAYFVKAGPSAYYQARVAYGAGTGVDRLRLREVAADGKITQAEYSDPVFRAFLRAVTDGASPFPEAEREKPVEQVRQEFLALADR